MLSRDQLDLVPSRLLSARSTEGLIQWLEARGWSMTLMELDSERRLRKGLSAVGARQMPPARRQSRHSLAPTPGRPELRSRRSPTAVAAPNACALESRFFDAPDGQPES